MTDYSLSTFKDSQIISRVNPTFRPSFRPQSESGVQVGRGRVETVILSADKEQHLTLQKITFTNRFRVNKMIIKTHYYFSTI